ncbi:MAG TPA: hypothetical protein VN151_09910 [Terracidiphilus sp.]|nr:hypothetical protein [Terracidiphilus sp.]
MPNALRRIFSFPAMLMVALFCSPFFASLDVQSGRGLMRDPDIWWHIRNAEVLLSTHHFIRAEAFSFSTPGQPWINFEWLSEIPYYLGFKALGDRGLFFVMLTAVELVIAGVLFLCYRRTRDFKASFLATWIAVLFASISIGLRTLLFGWLCFLVEMFLIEEFRKGRDRIWLLPSLFALWINLHATWIVGLAFYVLFIASGLADGSWGSIEAVRWTPQQLRKLALVGAASVAMLFVNPYGWQLVAYPVRIVLASGAAGIEPEEWRSVDFQTFHGLLLYVVVALLLVLTLARKRTWRLQDLLFAMLAVFAALQHRRFLFLAGIVLCPILAEDLAGVVFSPYDREQNKPLLNAAVMAAFIAFAIFHTPTSTQLQSAEGLYFPVDAVPELDRCCKGGRLFNHYEWGGYLIWHARQTPVFIDTRGDVFGEHGVFDDYINAVSLKGSTAILDRNRIDSALLPVNTPLAYLLKRTPGWNVQYEDPFAVLFVRSREGTQAQTHP